MTIELANLSAVELDALIVAAAKRRAELKPEPSAQPPEQCEAVFNPAWHTSPVAQGCLFLLRHPGLGWLGFVLPHEHRVHLASLWLHQSLLHKAAEPAKDPALPPASAPNVGTGGSGTLH
jgi:hypothetical protein